MRLLPQEIEVWYLIPVLRKELSVSLKKKGLSQKEIADLLGLTPAAVSQYIKEKRGKDNIPDSLKLLIEIYSNKIIRDEENRNFYFLELSKKAVSCGYLCYLHKKHEVIQDNCRLCFKT